MLSGGGGGALEEELSDSWNSDHSDRPACTLKFFFTSCFSSQVNLEEKKTTTCPRSSSVVLRSSDEPRLIIISLSQSDLAIDPAADHLELVGLEGHDEMWMLSKQ